MLNKFTILLLLLSLLIPVTVSAQDSTSTPVELCAAAFPAPEPETRTFTQAEQVLQEGVDYRAIVCTSIGPIYIDLYEDQTPATVNNFVFLAQQGYYNNTNFHRVISDFMVQAGDPTNTGTGGPGYQFEDEFLDDLVFDRPGLLAMANAGPGTNGSQFFITTVPTDWLNGAHTIFGEVLTGQRVVDNIRLRDPQLALNEGEALHTVIIVEDPTLVSEDEPTFAAATIDDARTTLEGLATNVPVIVEAFFPGISEVLAFDLNEATVFAPGEIQGLVSEANQATAAQYFSDHNHQYSTFTSVTNRDCKLADFPVQEIGYELDAYASVEDASAALDDGRLVEMLQNDGFEVTPAQEVPFTVLTRTLKGCDDSDMVEAVGLYQQEFVVVTASILLTADNQDIVAPLLNEFVKLFYYEALYPLLQPRVTG
ncbi:MAG: peptidylprolyl isomerase [Anaerolineae bacterium]|nr:peptidylprolyl isomerase [Anaerolineae bacterium]